MADWNYDDFADADGGGQVAQALNWAGAVLSLVLIAGLATWGWKLMMRDVNGVPVVRAMDGPMRIAPDDPGGEATAYQGLAVNRIAEEAVEERVDEVMLAPAPASLDDLEDRPMGEMAALAISEEDAAVLPEGTVEVTEAPSFADDLTDKLAEAPAAAPSATDLAVAAALAGIGEADLAPIPASLGVDTLGGSGPRLSPRPLSRPAGYRVASLTPAPVALDEVDAAAIPAGTRLVQLGAYASADVARIEWANALSRFGDYMVGKDRVVQEAQTGGKTFWRLRAHGFEDLADARRFCAVLVADGANCIPVVQE